MLKRLFDIVASFFALVILSPILLLIAILINFDSPGGVFYRQERIGKNGRPFHLYKFRSMKISSDKKGLITVGNRDSRITGIGYYLRKYKLDELPQLFNILLNDMSIVGPRPEVSKYVELYNKEQRKVLSVKPGLSDLASIKYFNENELLAESIDPEALYIKEIMPAKLRLNLEYLSKKSFMFDMGIIGQTILKILK